MSAVDYDAVVVGSGIAGLVAGIRLQLAGVRSLILERQRRAGGLCGSFEFGGHEFVIGCNDFGTGLVRELRELGVDVSFNHPKARFRFADGDLTLPPNATTVLRLAGRPLALARIIYGVRRSATLGDLVDRHIHDSLLKDAACIPAFAMLRSPDDVSIASLARDFSSDLAYGYDKSCTPKGGPQLLVDRMVRRFCELGGTLRLGLEFLGTRRDEAVHEVTTDQGCLRTRALLSSEGRWRDYPSGSKPGLEVAAALCVLDARRVAFPPGFHTLDWFEPGLADMLRRLDRGVPDDTPSFHAFCADLPRRKGCFTMNAFVPLARGESALSAQRRAALTSHVTKKLDRLCPGISTALCEFHLLSPLEIRNKLGVTAAPSPFVPPIPFEKPDAYDRAHDVHYLGTSVDPPGEHAGAAVLSGRRAAERVIASLAEQRRSQLPRL